MNYPIDIEARLDGLYQKMEKVEQDIEFMRRIYEMRNAAYNHGKCGELLPSDMVAGIQMLATIDKDDETLSEIAFIIMEQVCEAHAQGRQDANKQEGGQEDE